MTYRVPIIIPLQLFLLLLSEGTLLAIDSATNAYTTLIMTNPTTMGFHAGGFSLLDHRYLPKQCISNLKDNSDASEEEDTLLTIY
jgi:hypothetical protein